MSAYVLIVILGVYGSGSMAMQSVPFHTEAACTAARDGVRAAANIWPHTTRLAECYPTDKSDRK